MCGICGVVHYDKTFPVSEARLLTMRDTLTHRGPDDAGHYLAPSVALGARRLAILDLSPRGHMPMTTADHAGRYWISYNGEVYNFRELRAGLVARGYRFHSETDTEVVLNLFAEYGPEMLPRLNGMFAFAIWDDVERRLLLARDRLGVKPLYYHFQNGRLSFASEEKALFAAGVPAEFEQDVWEELLCFRYLSGERTPFRKVRRLLPGHYLLWQDGRITIRRWWNLAERAQERRASLPRNAAAWLRETFDDAVRLRRISDVPVGVLLSGGLDSSSVAASLATQGGAGAASFTMRFAEAEYDEGELARQAAAAWNLAFHELTLAPEDLLDELAQTAWFNDEPQAHANDTHLLAIARYAKPQVTVLLSGEGSDELLGGYVRYQPLRYPALLNAARPIFPRVQTALNLNGRWRKLSDFLRLGSTERFVLFNTCDTLPADLTQLGMQPSERFPFREQMLAEAQALYPGEPFRQAMYSDQHIFLCSVLDRNDRTTMGASIECRVPFLDYRLIEGLAALPTATLLAGRGSNKQLLRAAVGQRLPQAVLAHRKWGFAVPWRHYLRRIPRLREFVRALPEAQAVQDGPFERARVTKLVQNFLLGDDRAEELVRQLFLIAVWREAYFARLSAVQRTASPLYNRGLRTLR
jgi:asparagine synthase (glutamine-hydrolysing)